MTRQRFNAEPVAQRASVPLSPCPPHRDRADRERAARSHAGSRTCCPEPRRGCAHHEASRWRHVDYVGPLVRRRAAAAGKPGTPREGHRSGAAADCDSTRQGPEGPANRIANRRRRAVGPASRAREATTEADLARGLGRVVLPFALDRKYPNAPTEWAWQFVF